MKVFMTMARVVKMQMAMMVLTYEKDVYDTFYDADDCGGAGNDEDGDDVDTKTFILLRY